VIVGIIVGYVLSIYPRYGIFLLGCLLGYIAIMMIWSLLLHTLFRESIVALYILTILFMGGGAFLGYWLHNQIIVISTSYVGSYITFKVLLHRALEVFLEDSLMNILCINK